MEDGTVRERPDSMLVQRVIELLRSRLHKRGLAICISGIDGSGKTTLARNLVQVMQTSGVPVRHLHLYQWYVNVLVTPLLLLYNRYFDCKVLVLDRTIYDNIAVGLFKQGFLRRLSRMLITVVVKCYPRFDYRIYLFTSFQETRLRRLDTCENRFIMLSKIYDEIAVCAQYVRLRSDPRLFFSVLRYLG